MRRPGRNDSQRHSRARGFGTLSALAPATQRAALHYPVDLRNSSVETQSIVVLDFGAQYSQLIARRIREQNVFSVVLPCNATLEEIRSYSPVGIILSGGPSSVYDKDAPRCRPARARAGPAGARHLLRTAVHGAFALGGKVRAGGQSASTDTPRSRSRIATHACSKACRKSCRSGCRMAMRLKNCRPDFS